MTSNNMNEYLNELRLQKDGFDVFFEIDLETFPAHRKVLEKMKYFRDMPAVQATKKRKSTIVLDSQQIDPSCFDEFLNYVYTSKITLTNENIRAIYKTADHFKYDELTDKVKEHMKSTMSIENVFLYWNISVKCEMKCLQSLSSKFMIDNSSSDVIKNRISSLSFEKFKYFTDELKRQEKFEEMFNFSIGWILRDRVHRSGRLLELLRNVPLESLSFVLFKQDFIKDDVLLNDCLKLLLNTIVSKPIHSQIEQFETLYAIGGTDGQVSVSEYNQTTQTWTARTTMPSPKEYFGCAVIDQKIYVCGGWKGGQSVNELLSFDIQTRTWTQLRPMKHKRSNCSVAVLNRQIYVAGGHEDRLEENDRLSDTCRPGQSPFGNSRSQDTDIRNQISILPDVVEQYCMECNRWEDVASMPTMRSGLELVALNGFLYAIGGCYGDDTCTLDIVERYDPETDQWTAMNSTNYQYSSFGSAVLSGKIYIASGVTCEVYSPADDAWTEMPAPSKCGYGRRLAVYNGKLYAIGGVLYVEGDSGDDEKGTKTVEVYDFQKQAWQPEPDMDVARCFHRIAVVKT